LDFQRADRLSLTCDDPTIPVDDTNLVMRAARALGAPPVAIDLKKRIPAGGGLGGGSSDAATTLRALDSMFGLHRDDLPSVALRLGSDVPFFLAGGTAYATGRGEVLAPLPSRAGVALLLVLPEERVSTAAAFSRIATYSVALGIDAYREGYDAFTNDFEESVFSQLPVLASYKARLRQAGAVWAQMSGSGSTIVGAFASAAARDAAAFQFGDVRVEAADTI
jgi:4-diphosphocytidyl-2-C-methyl-D-erythritol kinase